MSILNYPLTRRRFIYSGSALVASTIVLPKFAFAKKQEIVTAAEKSLNLYNIHTGETFKDVFAVNDQFNPDALVALDKLLRDRRTNDVIEMNRELFDLLHTIHADVKAKQPLHIICGYRSKKTNDALRSKNGGVAQNSKHLTGDAIDLNIPGVQLNAVRAAAWAQKAGGVGYYPKSGFIHVDIRDKQARW
jgi:uncharacterized protein YcbK (DUF882 family)